MQLKILNRLILLLLVGVSSSASAGLADNLSKFIGYTIVDSKTIKGWYNTDDNESEEGAFKGCKNGRVIVFTDNKILKCSSYGYQYAFRPTAIILWNGSQFKMIVEDEIYDMSR
jgi:hypothetical protein